MILLRISSGSGFTLVELITTIAIAAILTTLAVAGFSTMVAANRSTTLANELVTALTLARSEAVKRGTSVSLCRSSNGSTCNGSNWNQGWLAFEDPNRNAIVDTGETLLQSWSAAEGEPVITANVTHVRFDNLGASAAEAAITVSVPGCKGNQATELNVGSIGRVRSSKVACE